MNVSIASATSAGYEPQPVRSDGNPQSLRILAQAADLVNRQNGAGDGREFSISIDRVSHEVVVRIIDSQTRNVIEQTPVDYLLRLRDYYSSTRD